VHGNRMDAIGQPHVMSALAADMFSCLFVVSTVMLTVLVTSLISLVLQFNTAE